MKKIRKRLLSSALAVLEQLDENQLSIADINSDGTVDIQDVTYLQKSCNKFIKQLLVKKFSISFGEVLKYSDFEPCLFTTV